MEFKNVSFSYSGEDNIVYAVEGRDFYIGKGSFTAIIGSNGSGKSTIAKLINGLLVPDSGVVQVDGMDTADDKLIWDIRKKVGMVFQNPDNQIIGTSVEEDVAFGMENIGIERDEMLRRIDSVLTIVDLSEYRYHAPHLLSGGQKQRVAIAGILAMEPECIVLDESTAMLDPIGRNEVMNVIKKLNKEKNITIIHITHHMEEVIDADNIFVVNEGKILQKATPREVFSDINLLRSVRLDVPQISELFFKLKDMGFNVPVNILKAEEAMVVLLDILGVK
ncbi:MAG: energy-coupling factor transporter ATPase [Oscillospiraceae bacterium]|nr:energy-coupling factor transporter ATPase [Oscillospiraceae bacterium]